MRPLIDQTRPSRRPSWQPQCGYVRSPTPKIWCDTCVPFCWSQVGGVKFGKRGEAVVLCVFRRLPRVTKREWRRRVQASRGDTRRNKAPNQEKKQATFRPTSSTTVVSTGVWAVGQSTTRQFDCCGRGSPSSPGLGAANVSPSWRLLCGTYTHTARCERSKHVTMYSWCF